MGRLTSEDISVFLRYLCSVSLHQEVHFNWRPWLFDSDDEMVLEAAVAAACPYIISYNRHDFREVSNFGVSVVTPAEFLSILNKSCDK